MRLVLGPTSGSARPPVAAPSLRFGRGNGRRASHDVGRGKPTPAIKLVARARLT